ncbi:hypothetical protein H5410_022591 [Solanum commersonii]|uniref:Uncharacterized protein n=1 Tax=Solanum commersonii TaxID=4109 RepID=A0A9J5ZJH9_SOLCO|nr:hypothetical protein H5410_022591 [Solanum commersonii]
MRTEVIVRATHTRLTSEKGRRIREGVDIVQKKFNSEENTTELYATQAPRWSCRSECIYGSTWHQDRETVLDWDPKERTVQQHLFQILSRSILPRKKTSASDNLWRQAAN